MVDLKTVQMELAFARRARREAEMAGVDLERVIAGMQSGRTLQQIELEEAAAPVAQVMYASFDPGPQFEPFRQAA